MSAPFVLLSHPDLFNCDVGDLTGYSNSNKTWSEDLHGNSWNDNYANMVQVLFDTFAAEQPRGVCVMGDLVEGHWGAKDSMFGNVLNDADRLNAMRQAARFYYGKWKEPFDERRLSYFPGIGDHELGDNPWKLGSWKWRYLNDFKKEFARALTYRVDGTRKYIRHPPNGTYAADTAYAKRLPSENDWNTLLITCDVFRKVGDANNNVHADIGWSQLDWIGREIDAARKAKPGCWVIVQAHTPVIMPVRFFHSSNLPYYGGTKSPFWSLLKQKKVDLLLHGEMHDMTVRTSPVGTIPLQVTHGAIPAWGNANYLRMAISDTRIHLQLKLFHTQFPGTIDRLWQTSATAPALPNFTMEPLDSTWWTTPTSLGYTGSGASCDCINAGGGDAGSTSIDKSSGRAVIGRRTGRFLEWTGGAP